MDTKKEIQTLQQKSGKSLKELEELHAKAVEEMKDFGFEADIAEQLAINRVWAKLKKAMSNNTETFEGVLLGWDGRVVDWAELSRKKVQKMIDKMGQEDAKKAGLIDDAGKYYYPADDFEWRAGKPIPNSDVSAFAFGIIKSEGKAHFAQIEFKSEDVLKKALFETVITFQAYKLRQKCTDKQWFLRVYDTDFVRTKEVSQQELMKLVDANFGHLAMSFDKFKERAINAGNLPNNERTVYLKDIPVQTVRKDVGENNSTLLNLVTPDFGELQNISLWLPEDYPKEVLEGTPVNVLGTLASYDNESKQISMNGIGFWYDEMYKPKEVPKKLDEAPKKEEKEASPEAW